MRKLEKLKFEFNNAKDPGFYHAHTPGVWFFDYVIRNKGNCWETDVIIFGDDLYSFDRKKFSINSLEKAKNYCQNIHKHLMTETWDLQYVSIRDNIYGEFYYESFAENCVYQIISPKLQVEGDINKAGKFFGAVLQYQGREFVKKEEIKQFNSLSAAKEYYIKLEQIKLDKKPWYLNLLHSMLPPPKIRRRFHNYSPI